MAPVIAPPVLGSAALAVVVVEVKTASLAEISTPSTVCEPEKVIFPLISPPDNGSAALALLVVVVKTASLAAISTPSTVPSTAILPVAQIPTN